MEEFFQWMYNSTRTIMPLRTFELSEKKHLNCTRDPIIFSFNVNW
jgi:hypothetical protein